MYTCIRNFPCLCLSGRISELLISSGKENWKKNIFTIKAKLPIGSDSV